ncbi:sulfur carrier protein ThiS [Thermogemmatispora sp.]|uniref:sulfur carrier protein ThiS n=1 Tax=Thermogemmatispora sp. TaxID=1968838 RepID=UPI001E0BCF84|nr:sulfur carrier protein ThiS [Thermogemmatispora sp.]MBX5451828.1 sulfur carrier protein ThiS [Thermogemmatispora sp.]
MAEDAASQVELMTIVANGQPWHVPRESTIADFLGQLALTPGRVVAMLDGTIIPRERFAETRLHEGCRLELVTMVGGG